MPLFDTPLGPNVISTTQNPIRQNFLRIGASFPVNHVNFDTGLTGWHTNLTFPAALATSSPALTANTQIAMLPFTGAISGVCELAIQKFGGTPIAFTEASKTAPQGWTRDASGVIWKWGKGTTAANSNAVDIAVNGVGATFGPNITNVNFLGASLLGISSDSTEIILTSMINFNDPNLRCNAWRLKNTGSVDNTTVRQFYYFVWGI